MGRYKWLLYLYIAAPAIAGIVLAFALLGLLPDPLGYLVALILAALFFALGMPAMLRVFRQERDRRKDD